MSKIEWTDITWNPVWGCDGGCEYCYARGIAKRFAGVVAAKDFLHAKRMFPKKRWYILETKMKEDLEAFRPTFLASNAYKLLPMKPKRIFANSMSDIAFWNPDWIVEVAKIMHEWPQHTFQILTKFPKLLYEKLESSGWGQWEFPNTVWTGLTITNNSDLHKLEYFYSLGEERCFISFEPLTEALGLSRIEPHGIQWVIVGGMTGRNAKPMPVEAVAAISEWAGEHGIPYFFKKWGKVRPDVVKEEWERRELP